MLCRNKSSKYILEFMEINIPQLDYSSLGSNVVNSGTKLPRFGLSCLFRNIGKFNPLNAELNPICHLLALLGAHHILHVSRLRVKPVKTEYS